MDTGLNFTPTQTHARKRPSLWKLSQTQDLHHGSWTMKERQREKYQTQRTTKTFASQNCLAVYRSYFLRCIGGFLEAKHDGVIPITRFTPPMKNSPLASLHHRAALQRPLITAVERKNCSGAPPPPAHPPLPPSATRIFQK